MLTDSSNPTSPRRRGMNKNLEFEETSDLSIDEDGFLKNFEFTFENMDNPPPQGTRKIYSQNNTVDSSEVTLDLSKDNSIRSCGAVC